MYFKCKSCGSNDYVVRDNKIVCDHCGSTYLYDDQVSEKNSHNIMIIALVLFTMLAVAFFVNIKTKDDKLQPKISYETGLNINNENAQIGTQIINLNTKEDKSSNTVSGKVVQHTKIKNKKNMDDSVGYTKDENGNIRNTIYLPRPKTRFDSQGNLIVDNKNINFKDQKVERYINKNGLLTTVVTTSGFNKKKNTLYLDKEGVIPLLGQTELPGGIVTDVKLSKDGNTLFYISRYDDLFIVDITKIKKPKVLSKTSILNMNDILLSKDEKKLYINSRDSLVIYDVSDKKAPKKQGNLFSTEYYRGMALSSNENELYIGKHHHNEKLAIIDISDPYHPKEKSDIPFREAAWPPAVNGFIMGTSNISHFESYILTHRNNDVVLFEDIGGEVKQLNHFNIEGAWHRYYQRARDMQFTKNGRYVAFIANKNAISFKRATLLLPKYMVDRDALHNKDDYFGYGYSAIVQPNIDKIKKIVLSQDGRRLFAFSSNDLFVYDISKLK